MTRSTHSDLLEVQVHHLRSADQPVGGQHVLMTEGRDTGIRFMAVGFRPPRTPGFRLGSLRTGPPYDRADLVGR